jgi:hypothetical protein
MQISTIGIDLAKTVFQIHAVDADGKTVVRKRLRGAEVLSFFAGLDPCLIWMEACATSHYWARELTKFGHTVKLMPPAYVKPYVKRGKNDATEAEAICEAVTRPNMRFCSSQERRPASGSHAASHAGTADPAADDAGKRVPGASCGVWDRGRARHQACARTDRESLRRRRARNRSSALARIALRPLVAQLMELRLNIKMDRKSPGDLLRPRPLPRR